MSECLVNRRWQPGPSAMIYYLWGEVQGIKEGDKLVDLDDAHPSMDSLMLQDLHWPKHQHLLSSSNYYPCFSSTRMLLSLQLGHMGFFCQQIASTTSTNATPYRSSLSLPNSSDESKVLIGIASPFFLYYDLFDDALSIFFLCTTWNCFSLNY